MDCEPLFHYLNYYLDHYFEISNKYIICPYIYIITFIGGYNHNLTVIIILPKDDIDFYFIKIKYINDLYI